MPAASAGGNPEAEGAAVGLRPAQYQGVVMADISILQDDIARWG
jgi:hypothetical protein